MNAKHLRDLIKSTLRVFSAYSTEAVDLLMLTAAQESFCGETLRQLGGGPALGIFQMEPETYNDIMSRFIPNRPDLGTRLNSFRTSLSPWMDLEGNLLFQIVIARVNYMRIHEAIPKWSGNEEEYIRALAAYWKKYWNTKIGKGTQEEAIANYKRYVVKALNK